MTIPEVLTLRFTKTCNLACEYCYVPRERDDDTPSLAELLHGRDYFEQIKAKYGTSFKHIALWGGEPTINLPILTEHITDEFVTTFFPQVESVTFSTNLSLPTAVSSILAFRDRVLDLTVDWPFKKRLQEGNKFYVQVSFDGPPFLNDKWRKGSHVQTILRRCRELASAGIGVGFKPTISADGLKYLCEDTERYEAFTAHNQYVSEEFQQEVTTTFAMPGEYTVDDGVRYAKLCNLDRARGRKTWIYVTLNLVHNASANRNALYHSLCSAGRPNSIVIDDKQHRHWCHNSYGNAFDDSKIVDAENAKSLARFEYVGSYMGNSIAFSISQHIALVEQLALAGLISPIFKKSQTMRQLLVLCVLIGRNCTIHNFEANGDYMLPSASLYKLFGNGAFEDELSWWEKNR